MIRRAGVVVIACACGGSPSPKSSGAPSGPLRIELGACAAPTVSFVSGKRELVHREYGGLLGDEAGEMNGGFGYGRSGYGPGGGGTGYGLGGRPNLRPAAGPTISIGQPTAAGDLDKAIIRRYIKRNQTKLLYCYAKQLPAKPRIEGTVNAQFFIKPDGQVDPSAATGVNPEVASCVAAVIKDIEFPKPKGGGGVQVSYPFTFRAAGDPSEARPGDEPAPVPKQEPTEGRDAAKPAEPADHPFAAKRAELADCLRRQEHPYGALVVELSYHARGEVTAVTTHGLDDATARACVDRVARTIVKTRGPAIERCAIAFGTMPADHLPGIDVSSFVIKVDRRPIARLTDADAELLAASQRTVAAIGALATDAEHPPAIAIRGPIVLRAIDIAPMKLVNRALAAARSANVVVEPAVLRDGEWRLLHGSRVIPEVPVALPVQEPAAAQIEATIDVLVTSKAILVPTNDAVVEAKDAAAFAEQVTALAHGAWPAGAVVALAARDDVRFGELARAIAIVEHAGLRWRIAPPKGN